MTREEAIAELLDNRDSVYKTIPNATWLDIAITERIARREAEQESDELKARLAPGKTDILVETIRALKDHHD